jgi:hypothetical protein
MKRMIMPLLCILWGLNSTAQKKEVVAEVDPRVELLAILSHMAGLGGYDNKVFKVYLDDVNKHFAKDSLHPAVVHLKNLKSKNHLGYDAVMRMAIHLDYPLLKPKLAFTPAIPEPRWTEEGAKQFVPLVQQFYKDTRFDSFFKAHRSLYTEVEKRFQVLLDEGDYSWFPRYYGYKPEGKFSVYLGLLNGGISYGPKVEYPDGHEEFYAIMANYKVDEKGLPVFDPGMLGTVVHEFNHSFINHLILNDSLSYKPYGEKIYSQVAYQMKQNYYPVWTSILYESLVRAAVIRYLMEHDSVRVAPAVAEEYRLGFYWIEDLVNLLGVYENNRQQYKTFAAFMPVIRSYLKDLTENGAYKYKAYEEKLPRIVTTIGITNGQTDVDPSLKEMVFIFSRPMKGWSFGHSALGKEHYGIESIAGWDESFTQLTVKMNLKPKWNYEFLVLSQGFRTREGHALEPVVFKFSTR